MLDPMMFLAHQRAIEARCLADEDRLARAARRQRRGPNVIERFRGRRG